jgi:hypothetical protein
MRSAVLPDNVWDMVPPSKVESRRAGWSEAILSTAAASHPSLAVRSAAFSLPPSAAAAVAVQIVFPQEEECAGAGSGHWTEAFAASEMTHSG